MHKKAVVVSVLVLISSFVYLSSFDMLQSREALPIEQVKEQFYQEIDAFQSSIEQLKQQAQAYNEGKLSTEAMQQAVLECRLSYKAVEPLMAYLDPQAVKDYVNGAPLLSTERKAPGLFVLEPEGLQVLDELAFSDALTEEKEALLSLVEQLSIRVKPIATFQRKVHLTDRQVFEALRTQLVRIFTLGLTGFDTPGSLNGIVEAERSIQSMSSMAAYYYPYLEKQGQEGVVANLENAFTQALTYLKAHQDFDTFDRLHFAKTYINPLYGWLLDAHLALNIETVYETTNRKQTINYYSRNIFATDFLDVESYTSLPKKYNEEQLTSLGRTLFFDPILSYNNQRACASCHIPEKAFTDGKAKSVALNFEGTVDRNAPSLVNVVFSTKFFWDVRSKKLEDQIEHVLYNHKEFNTNFPEVFKKLNNSAEYRKLFTEAFPQYKDRPVFRYTLSMALSAYIKSLVGLNSSFDQYMRGETADIAPEVKRGFNLFMGKAACGTCHFAPIFNGTVPPDFHDSESEVLGVPATADKTNPKLDADLGRYGSKVAADQTEFYKNSFKTVTVRNAELSAPYMHNGVYKTLDEVLDFYNNGGGAGMGLDVPHQTLAPDSLGLTTNEMQDIIAFMKALTDTKGLEDKPAELPQYEGEFTAWNKRKVGGEY